MEQGERLAYVLALRVANPHHLEGGSEEPWSPAHRRPPPPLFSEGLLQDCLVLPGFPRLGVEATPWTFLRLTSGQPGLYRVHPLGPFSSIPQEKATQAPHLHHCLCPRKSLDIWPVIIQLFPWPGQLAIQFGAGPPGASARISKETAQTCNIQLF